MDRLYRFSPITGKDDLFAAIQYVASKTTELCRNITGENLPISSLTLFAHYPDEFENLKKLLFDLGILDHENNGPFVKLHKPIQLATNKLELLRVRQPDPYRMQVGCNDFKVPNYREFKNLYLINNPDNLRVIKRPEYEMIEFFDPDFDVLAYVLSN